MTTNPPDNPALAAARSMPREFRNLLAGGLAGMLAKSVVAPIDRIKILYQVTSARFHLTDVPKVAYSIVEKEGWAALWKGNTATMIRVFPYSGIQFMVFDYCKVHFLGEKRRKSHKTVPAGDSRGDSNISRTISHRGTVTDKGMVPGGGEKKGGLSPVESLKSGMVAGAVSVMCTYPLDVARAQLAVLRKKKKPRAAGSPTGGVKGSKKGIGYVLTTSFQRGGLPGLYRGITPTMLGILPYSGVAFTINEQAKRQVAHIMQREPTTIERLQCGALSGLFAQTLAYPLEVTRRRMQTIGIVPTSGSESASINFTGVSRLKHSADELPETETRRQQRAQSGPRLNIAGNSASSVTENAGQSVINSGRSNPEIQQQPRQYHKPPSMVTTMRHLLEEQGVRGFYKGVSMNWVKGPIAFSISFTAFDTMQKLLQSDSEKEEKRLRSFTKNSEVSISRRLTNNEDGD